MRVLHCIYDDPANPWVGGGGAERVLEIYRRLAGRRAARSSDAEAPDSVDATVLAGAFPGAGPRTRDGVSYVYAGLARPYPLSRLSYGRSATRTLHAGDYDAAVFDFSVYTPIRVPARRIGHVVHMPIGPAARDRFGRLVGGVVAAHERRMLGAARLVSTTSEWMAERLRKLIAPGGLIRIVRSGVADDFYGVSRTESDYLLYYGRFDWYQKGLDTLLEAATLLFRQHRDVRLVIAGRGKDAERMRAAVARHPEAARIELIPNPDRARVLRLMSGALALLHPSRFEGYPVVPGEAMAAGVPVVATDVGAVSELSAGAALLIEPGSADTLADAAQSLLTSAANRSAASAAGRERASALTWDVVAREHLEFLRLIAADGGR